jgi:hypothetical protein
MALGGGGIALLLRRSELLTVEASCMAGCRSCAMDALLLLVLEPRREW